MQGVGFFPPFVCVQWHLDFSLRWEHLGDSCHDGNTRVSLMRMELRSWAAVLSPCCGEQCLLQFSAGHAQGGPDFRCSLYVFASRGVRRWGLRGSCWSGQVSTPDGEDLAWVGIAKGSRWCSLLIWHKAGVVFLSPVLDEPGRAWDSSLLHQNSVNYSALRTCPRYEAAFVICEAEHLPGEEDVSAPAGRMNACLRAMRTERAGSIKLNMLGKTITTKLLVLRSRKFGWISVSSLSNRNCLSSQGELQWGGEVSSVWKQTP